MVYYSNTFKGEWQGTMGTVTARIPDEIQRQGTDILKELGATTTQLVNAAYTYLISQHRLPAPLDTLSATASADGPVTHRSLDADARAELASSIEATTFDLSGEGGRA